jgi:hypothetical protein
MCYKAVFNFSRILKLHSERVEKMGKLHSKRVEKIEKHLAYFDLMKSEVKQMKSDHFLHDLLTDL